MSDPIPSVQVPAGSPVIVQCGCQPRPATRVWESYLSGLGAEPDPTTWQTRILWPIE